VREVIAAAEEVTGRPVPYEMAPRRAGDPAVLVASSERAKRELGWQPKYTDLRSIIESAWRWHSNPKF
jgi:UDP-glucose 4-epimerase